MLRTLIGLECKKFLSINVFFHSRNQKNIHRHCGMNLLAYLLVAGVGCGLLTGQIYGLTMLGAGKSIPALLISAGTMLILLISVFGMGQSLFSSQGLAMLQAMPIKREQIALARILAQYLGSLVLAAVLLIPGTVLFGVLTEQTPVYYLGMLLGIAGLPLIPLAAAVLVSTAILSAAARTRHPVGVQAALSVLTMGGLLCLGLFGNPLPVLSEGQNFIADQIVEGLPQMLWYAPANWAGESALSGEIGGILVFLALSLLIFSAVTAIVCRNFDRICQHLFRTRRRREVQMGTLRSGTPFKALYVRECRRYFASEVYVSNTIIGPILAAAGAVALLFLDLRPLERILPVSVQTLAPVAWTMICCMMPACAVSVTMEGRQIWQIKTLPIGTKTWLDSKLMWNLTLMLPSYLLSEVVMTAALHPDFGELLWQVGIPLALMAFSCVFAIAADLRLHNFDYEKDEIAVKQSLSTLVGGFGGVLSGLVCGGVLILSGNHWQTEFLLFAFVTAAAGILYVRNIRTPMERI